MLRSPWFQRAYKKSSAVKELHLKVEGKIVHVLVNPSKGGWAVLTDEEYEQYRSLSIPQPLSEFLFTRQLLMDDEEFMEIDFIKPPEIPHVAVINITENCNLVCDYCFAGCTPHTHDKPMSKDVMKAIVQNMNEATSPDGTIIYDFQGGEPLLHYEAITQFINIVQNNKTDSSPDFRFRLTTNGTIITDEIIKLLKEYSIDISVSIDGFEEVHNQHRYYPDGRGSFNGIWKSVQKLKDNGVPFGAIVNITKSNVMHGEKLVDFFSTHGISFKPRPVNILGRELVKRTAPSNNEWADCYIRMAKRSHELQSENVTQDIFEKNVLTPLREYFCLRFPCGAGREVVNFNVNGDVFPCDGLKSLPEFSCGNILNSSLKEILNHPTMHYFRYRSADKIEKCSACLFRSFCGSCAYSCLGAFGDCYREDPYCKALKKIYTHTIKTWIETHLST
jgi:radical SAM protein with 4Fe4S-binding SPASM domain